MKLVSYCFAFILLLTIIDVNGNAYPKKERTAHTYISQYENVLGTSMELKISTYSQADATVAENAVLGEIKRLSKILSAYDTQSEFSKWLKTSGQQVHVSNELFRIMQLFDEWRTRTNGALDASAEVVTTLWKQAALKQHIPTQKEIDNAVAEVKQTHWLLDTNAKTATHIDHAPLMLNSFVKNYIIKDAVDAALKTGDIKAVVLNIGGDMVIAGDVDEHVFISDPKADAE
ncbi:MAG: FAD:protein FMN transferase, partial [Bacteroidetes bacterium]|nr:FAD:protein FMN transferase [Bacteroidota bacterium]